MAAKVKRLEELCYQHILGTLEEYPVETLALLPAGIRTHMLSNIPVMDVCRLEETSFTSGMEMNLIWKTLYEKCIEQYPYIEDQVQPWKERFLGKLCDILFEDDRPYGYFQLQTRRGKSKKSRRNADKITTDRPVHEHPVDPVNYLVASKILPRQKSGEREQDDEESSSEEEYDSDYDVMNRHAVTVAKGIVPPSSLYHQACQINQVIPQRHASLFPQDSYFLPDTVAIDLLCRACKFYPKDVHVCCPEFSTFLENAKHELGGSDTTYLAEFFSEVESLTISGDIEESRGGKGTNLQMTVGAVIPAKALELVLSNDKPKLSSLFVHVDYMEDKVLESITPILTSSYDVLKEFSLSASGKVCPDLERLIAITRYQSQLQKITILMHEVEQCFGCFQPVIKSTPHYSHTHLLSLIELNIKKPLLREMTLGLSPINAQFSQEIITAFLSLPCSHNQTLILKSFEIDSNDMTHNVPLSVASCPDGSSPIQYCKSISLEYCHFSASFSTWLFSFRPLQLKELTITDTYDRHSHIFPPLVQQETFDCESLKIDSMLFEEVTEDDFKCLLQKPSMKCIHLINCLDVDLTAFANALIQLKDVKLVEFQIEFAEDDYISDEDTEALCSAIFSLPQLSQFSLTLLVSFSEYQLQIIYTSWKLKCAAQMKAFHLRIPGSIQDSSLHADLQSMATKAFFDVLET